MKENGLDAYLEIERDYDCSGMCKLPLFFQTRDFDEKPKDICLNQISKKMAPKLRTAGIVALITAFFSFIAFCGTFTLCSKQNEKWYRDFPNRDEKQK